MLKRTTGLFLTVLMLTGSIAAQAFGSAQGAKRVEPSRECAYGFAEHQARALARVGWECTPEELAVAERLQKRGFLTKHFVEAVQTAAEIPGTEPADVETIAVLNTVAITPKYYFMIDKDKRPSLTDYYNVKLYRRGRILTAVGYAVAALGFGMTAASIGIFAYQGSLNLGANPGAAAMLWLGPTVLVTGISMGTIGVHKLRLVSYNNALENENMMQLRSRRTKTRHFAPDDLFDYQQGAPERQFIRTSFIPVVGEDSVGLVVHVVF